MGVGHTAADTVPPLPTVPHLEFLVARDQSLTFELNADLVSVGRSKTNSVQINEANVSGRHAEFICQHGVWYCRDLHSTNGTHINGERLNDQAQPLQDGDFITFASVPGIYRAAGARPVVGAGIERFETGAVLERQYQLGDFLGESPGCDNFRALDLIHHVPVVVKKYDPEIVARNGGLAAVGQETARIQGVPHANLIRPLALRPWHDGGVYMTYRWLESASLIDVLRVRGKLNPAEALLILRPVAGAIDHVRKSKLVGLDLNPRPILLSFNGEKPTAAALEALFGTRLENWPPFTLKLAPLLILVDEGVSPEASRVANGDNEDLVALALLVCELFGHAVPQNSGARRPARIIIPALGDAGNNVLARAMVLPKPDFASAVDFIKNLADALRL